MDTTARKDDTLRQDHPYVHEVPGVCGGYPVIRNTRIPVYIVVDFYQELGDVEKVAEVYPNVTPEQIRGALDFYAAHPARVDEDRERNERAWAEIIERNVPIQGRLCPDEGSGSIPMSTSSRTWPGCCGLAATTLRAVRRPAWPATECSTKSSSRTRRGEAGQS